MANATDGGNDLFFCMHGIADAFQQYAATATTTYDVLWNGMSFNVSSVLTVATATSAIGETLGTIAITTQVGGVTRNSRIIQLMLMGFIAASKLAPGSTQNVSFSAGASTTWNTNSVTITRIQ